MKKFAVGLMLSVVVMGSSVKPTYAAENFFQRVTNSIGTGVHRFYLNVVPGNKNGRSVMDHALKESEKLKSAHYNAVIDVDLQDDGRSLAKLKISAVGDVEAKDMNDPSTMKQDLKLTGEASMEGTSLKMSADMKMIGDMAFFKINEVPPLPMNIDEIKGKWLKNQTKSESKLTSEDMQKMREAYNKMWKEAQLSDAKKEKKNDRNVFVIDATVPKAALKAYITEVIKIQAKTSGEAVNETQINQTMDRLLESMGEVKSVMWVDRSNFQIRHTELPLTFTLPPRAAQAPVAPGNPMAALANVDKIQVNIVVDTDKFNEAVNITEPSDAQDMQQAIQQMMMNNSLRQTQESPSELPTLNQRQRLELQRLQQQQLEELESMEEDDLGL